jgi:hypothetical protein
MPAMKRKDRKGIWFNLVQLLRHTKQAFNAVAFQLEKTFGTAVLSEY